MQNNKWELLFGLAEEQHAAFTTHQAEQLGIDDHTLARAKRDRLIDRVRPRVWAVLALIDEWTPMAAIQLAQPRAVAGYRAGAVLQAFDGVETYAIDVLVPPNVWLRGATVHRVEDLVVPEIVVINGLRCTDEVRTLIDYAAVTDDDHVERAMESVFRRDPSKRALLVDRATALARPGKSGPARALRVEAKLPDVRSESDLETVYDQTLRHYGVELPVRQHPVGRFRLDRAYPDIKLFVELDGYGAHGTWEAFIQDRHRQNVIVGQDWSPLRFTDSDVRRFGRRTAMTTQREITRRRARLVVPSVV
jgi:very-short-patch-repair endonuclease